MIEPILFIKIEDTEQRFRYLRPENIQLVTIEKSGVTFIDYSIGQVIDVIQISSDYVPAFIQAIEEYSQKVFGMMFEPVHEHTHEPQETKENKNGG